MPTETRIDLLRHGEPVGGRRYRGQIDDPLSEKGWQQMRAAVADRRDWDIIYTSPLRRCAEFAAELASRHGLPLTSDPRLKEIGFGSWEGCTAEQLRRQDPQRIERFWRDPVANRPEGAETIASFHARVSEAWRELLGAHPGKRILVVGHAGITRMVLSLVLDSPPQNIFRIAVENAGLTRLRVRGTGTDLFPVLVYHGQAHE